MKKIMLLSILSIMAVFSFGQAPIFHVNPVIKTVNDGGGKNAGTVVLKNNTEYRNYGNGTTFTANQQPVHDLWIHDNKFMNMKATCIFIGAYATQPQHTNKNIKIDSNQFARLDSQQYYVQLASTDSIEMFDNSCINSTGCCDGGYFYLQYSGAYCIHNNFFDKIHGKALRLWSATGSQNVVCNNIMMNMDQYSTIESQMFYGVSDHFNVDIYNNTSGNLPVVAGNGTGMVTLYYPSTVSQVNSTFSFYHNRVFNSSAGLLDNGSNTIKQPFTGQLTGPYAPSNSNWTDTSINQYRPTMQAFGWANDSAVTLPDGSSWQTNAPAPVPNLPPVANAGPNIIDTLPAITATLDGTRSADPDGSIATYSWVQVSGNPVALISPSASKTQIAGISIGKYVFSLTVTDNKGLTNTAIVTVTGFMLPYPGPCAPVPPPPPDAAIHYSLINGSYVPALK